MLFWPILRIYFLLPISVLLGVVFLGLWISAKKFGFFGFLG